MQASDFGGAVKIGKRAGDAQYAMIAARRKPHRIGSFAAFGPQTAGQINPSPRALAPIAAGSTPATGAIEPSRPSSPNTVKPARASWGMAPIAAISPSAIGRS